MDDALLAVAAVLCIVAVNTVAPRIRVAAPLVLVLIGVAISLLPSTPAIEVDPEWILAGVLPPLLYSTSVSMPTMEFRRDFSAIGGLSVVLVVISSVLLGLFFAAVLDLDLALGIALGAIVSPTDAVATTMVKKLRAPPRVVTLLEGESLLNDASALVLLRSAIAATAATVGLGDVVADFVRSVVIAVVVGWVVGEVSLRVRSRIGDPALTTAVSFTVPFIAYVPSEHVGASGLVAAVVAGAVTGQGAARFLRPQDRISEASNWRTVELLLEGAVFLLMGLELYGLVEEVRQAHGSLRTALAVGTVAAVLVVFIRAAYVTPVVLGLRMAGRRAAMLRAYVAEARENSGGARPAFGPRRRGAADGRRQRVLRDERLRTRVLRRVADIAYIAGAPIGPREGVVLVWAGMRGAVTLAAAQSLPHDTDQRAVLVLVAFVVAAGTLLVQGGTLPWVVRRLGLVGGHETQAAEERAALRGEIRAAGARVLERTPLRRRDGGDYTPGVVDRVRADLVLTDLREEEEERDADDREPGGDRPTGTDGGPASGPPTRFDQYRELRLRVIAAQREALLAARDLGTFSSEALESALTVLDADQLSLELRSGPPEG